MCEPDEIIERCRYGPLRMIFMVVLLGMSGTMLATLASSDSCRLVLGVAPVAWGCVVWWMVDMAALMSFWVWTDADKLKKQLFKWRNFSTMLMLFGARPCSVHHALAVCSAPCIPVPCCQTLLE